MIFVVLGDIVIDGGEVSPSTLLQAGTFSMCYSSAWNAKIVTSAWWVYPEQVSQRRNSFRKKKKKILIHPKKTKKYEYIQKETKKYLHIQKNKIETFNRSQKQLQVESI